MVRQFFVFLHRWVGLAMTVFLVIVGLTGSVLAFREEIDVLAQPGTLDRRKARRAVARRHCVAGEG